MAHYVQNVTELHKEAQRTEASSAISDWTRHMVRKHRSRDNMNDNIRMMTLPGTADLLFKQATMEQQESLLEELPVSQLELLLSFLERDPQQEDGSVMPKEE